MWLAPEIVRPGTIVESKPADIFAFAMLALEIFTGKLPFEERGRTKGINRILKGDRPQFPQDAEDIGLTIQIQSFLEKCWCQDPEERPTIDEVVSTLERLLTEDDSMRRPSNGQNPGEPVPDEDQSSDGPHSTRQGKHSSSSIDTTNLSASYAAIYRTPK